MEIVGYLIFIWAFAQSFWLLLRKAHRRINPPIPYFIISFTPSEWFMDFAEQELTAMASKQAHDELVAIEDAKMIADLKEYYSAKEYYERHSKTS